MARLDSAIIAIVDVFMEYADDEGKKGQLNKEELKNVLEKEIQSAELKNAISASDIDEAMGLVDKNHDGEVNIREFFKCIGRLGRSYYQSKKGKGGKKSKGKEDQED